MCWSLWLSSRQQKPFTSLVCSKLWERVGWEACCFPLLPYFLSIQRSCLPKDSQVLKVVFFPLFKIFLRIGIARLTPEAEITLCHCNLQMVESAAESRSYEQACYTNIKKWVLDMPFLSLGLQRCTLIRSLSQKGFRLCRFGPRCPQSQMAFETTLLMLHLALLGAFFW